MRWAWVLGVLVLTAGCLSGAGEETRLSPQEAEQLDEEETEEIERTFVFEADVQASAGDGRIDGIEWPAPLGPGLTAIELELVWEQGTHNFGVDVEGPTDAQIGPERDPTSAELSAEFPNAAAGSYAFYPTLEGAVASDSLTLTVTATFVVPEDESLSLAGCTDIETRQTADGWRASFACQASGPTSSAKRLAADTVNGEVAIDGADEGALAAVNVWARGTSEEQARQRAATIDVTVRVTEDGIVARAEAPDWEDRGADVDVGVEEATLTGRADTTNGPIEFSDVRTDGIEADTTNGPIRGDLTGGGDLAFDTTNGPIEVAITPEDAMGIEADTTNGAIELGLTETSQIAYSIDAETTNGRITEDMDEAHLEGEEDDARLVTEDGESRPIQVTGDTDTTNGGIHFDGR